MLIFLDSIMNMESISNNQFPPAIHTNEKLIILIIGSTGNIGRGILDAFQHSTSFQTAINNNLLEIRATFHSLKSKQLIEQCYPSIKPVELDIDKINVNNRPHDQSIETVFAGVNCLFLQTGYFIKSIIQSKTIIDYAKAVNVEFILHGGVLAQDNTINESFAFHILIEKYIEHLGFKYCHLHPAVYMQVLIGYVGEKVVDLKKNQVELYWTPDYLLTWVDCNDVGKVAASILCDYGSHLSKIYQLTADQVTMEQITRLFSKEFQMDLKYNYINAEHWADLTCNKILENKEISNQDKFSQCDYIHAIKQAFLRHNNNTFDEKWKIYSDLDYLLNHYHWNKTGNKLEEFIKNNRELFLI
uniref:NmrA-like family domain-containing protein 1 n=1 Tax=Adineta vaga TaxID=104782 RepID=B3G4E4_ADIVA|nr:NmrA family protein-like protein [Adineta vaga]